MYDTIGYAVVTIFIIGSIYGLYKQVQYTLNIQKDNKSYKRLLIGNYIASFSLIGFIISYVLNILVGSEFIQSNIITSSNTGLSCFIFLAALLIARYKITPRNV